ncbi:MAG: permease [Gemmatimonadetes bacterium]|nr:permease [Gemmatimonadota bacterium]
MRRPLWMRSARKDAELDEEINAHLAMATAERMARGESPAWAADSARREFGNALHVKEVTREMWAGGWMERLLQDVRYAARALARARVFTVIVCLMLAIGIGVNGAVLSIMDTAYLRKLAVPDPDRIMTVHSGDARNRPAVDRLAHNSFDDTHDIASALQGMAQVAAYSMAELKLGGEFAGTTTWSALVSGSYFSVLGVRAARGRAIGLDEERPVGAHPVVVISDHLWHDLLGADPQAVGRGLVIGKEKFTIIGIMPPSFLGIHPEGRTEMWIPYTMDSVATSHASLLRGRDARRATTFVRLAPAVTISQLKARLDALAPELAARYPREDSHLRFLAEPHPRMVTTTEPMNSLPAMLLVLAMVGLLHLVACSNVAGLMMARAASRRRELGVRLCLGASQGRILRLLLTESLLLAGVGCAGGIIISRWLVAMICRMRFLSTLDAGLDLRLVAIVVAFSAATAIQFGLLPARDASKRDPLEIIRGRTDGATTTAHPGFLVAQVAFSLLLLALAASMASGFSRQVKDDTGYDVSHVVYAAVALQLPQFPQHDAPDRVARIHRIHVGSAALRSSLLDSVLAVPGVERAALTQRAPLAGGGFDNVRVHDHQYGPDESTKLSTQLVGPGYFATIGAALLRGREFAESDRWDGEGHLRGVDAVIVNESMARKFWPGADPIGRLVTYREQGAAMVIGVVRDMRDVSTLVAMPRAYFPILEFPLTDGDIVVRARDPEAMVPLLRAALTRVPGVMLDRVRTLQEIRSDATLLGRIASIALATCAGIALLLTGIGLYGVVAMWATARRTEIGIRMALGARSGHVHRLLLGRMGGIVAIGACLGTALAVAALQLTRAWLGPMMTFEVGSMASALLVLAGMAAVATYLPSRRATKIAPTIAMRAE